MSFAVNKLAHCETYRSSKIGAVGARQLVIESTRAAFRTKSQISESRIRPDSQCVYEMKKSYYICSESRKT